MVKNKKVECHCLIGRKEEWEKQKHKMTHGLEDVTCVAWAWAWERGQWGEGGGRRRELNSKHPGARARPSAGLFPWTFLLPDPWEEVAGLSGPLGEQP